MEYKDLLSEEIEALRKELNLTVDENGLLNKKTICISRKLDKLISQYYELTI